MELTVRLAIDLPERASRTPTVLVLSEDPDWLAAVRRVLEQEGYRVLTARHAGHALVECMRHDGRIDLLLTDRAQGRREPDFPLRIFGEHPKARLLHLAERPLTRDELVAVVTAAVR